MTDMIDTANRLIAQVMQRFAETVKTDPDVDSEKYTDEVWEFYATLADAEADAVWAAMPEAQRCDASTQSSLRDDPTATLAELRREAVAWHFTMNPPPSKYADFLGQRLRVALGGA